MFRLLPRPRSSWLERARRRDEGARLNLSAADDPEQWKAWASGADSVVAKPSDIDALVAELADAFGSTPGPGA